jgi:radical SAM protein with 4Fe4S-binding SPASM domain
MALASFSSRATAMRRLMAPGPQMPVYLLMFVTNRCNATCDHCFYWRELNTKVKQELTIDEYDRLARSMGPMLQVTFTGGSPELRKDLPDLVERFYEHCQPANMTFCMLGHSTARILTQAEEMLRRCPKQKFKIGISLDGLGEDHDRLRGIPGLFDRVVATVHGLADLKRHYPNLRVDIGMTVHGLNYQTIFRTAEWVRANLPVDVLKPILVRGDPLNANTLDDICKTTYLNVVDQDAPWLSGARLGRDFSLFDYLVHAKEKVSRDIVVQTSHTGTAPVTCAGARETAVIYPTGDIAGCELREDVLGNIRETGFNFRRVWFGDKAQNFRATTGKVDACNGCYHHCFISPALFRTPKMWPRMVEAAWEIHRNLNSRPRAGAFLH